MTQDEAKNLRAMKYRYVKIVWRNPEYDWPYFRLLEVDAEDDTIKLRRIDNAEREVDEFWTYWRDVKSIEPVQINT